MSKKYWLLKSDPDSYGWDELEAESGKTTCWDGVRNYQARNLLRDEIKVGDDVLFYHSQTDKAVIGTARVVRRGYPDPTQFDRRQNGFDPAAAADNPRWYAVDIQATGKLKTPVTLSRMRGMNGLEEMVLLRKGSRLSVQPVTAGEWKVIVKEGGRRKS
jgi:predicted RNA-binding protein with PUA-like domain